MPLGQHDARGIGKVEGRQVGEAGEQATRPRQIFFLESLYLYASSMAASSRLRPRRSRMMWSNSARTIGETLIE